jgi:signal transduction histidine kinase
LNLLSNAIKYTNKEGSIAIKLNQKIVDNRAMACIQVCDNGIGIPPDKYEYIFERFGQVDNTFSRQAEGTGIGLHLTKMFVELLGGKSRLPVRLEREVYLQSFFRLQLSTRLIRKRWSLIQPMIESYG